ncbi:uncharacterized protein H6S33_002699 [Morchella sextelata]|uniref:uncharacterized protein n=1 Tax=Morchella sextelata TaxID=1174677 RepID=UPI001D0410CB|nr:uncharacterized protein H6S33_002699 [Morchella sextelata]KAH0607665.1 hypothetical protein H6S33_002699 [Morchella sextelata]
MLIVDSAPAPAAAVNDQQLPDLAKLTISEPTPITVETIPAIEDAPAPAPAAPAHVHPDGPKVSAPFQFGSRLLLSEDEVFTFNAWDHVETDPAYKAYSAAQYASQRSKPVSASDKKRFMSDPAKWWDLFYKNNKENFFKDRKWLQQEFPILAEATREGAGEVVMVELGCGAGNTLFPVLKQNANEGFRIVGCDFSAKAVEVVRTQPLYAEHVGSGRVRAEVYDLSEPDTLPVGVEEGTVDVVIMVFVFSALAPEQWSAALGNVRRMLKKGGKVLFRDYGRGDLAQVRFKAGRYLDENFYVRGDGTRVYFFEQWELRKIFTGEAGETEEVNYKTENGEIKEREKKPVVEEQVPQEEEETQEEPITTVEKTEEEQQQTFPEGDFGGFVAREMGVDRRLLVNRKRQLKMYRCWMQAVFEKL